MSPIWAMGRRQTRAEMISAAGSLRNWSPQPRLCDWPMKLWKPFCTSRPSAHGPTTPSATPTRLRALSVSVSRAALPSRIPAKG